ncbi:MAG TPA: glycosyltransferase family 2 protein, partial [Methanosarcina sp.]|nr:glycosyltransferase family 2 protein [Methanosarcina sp.]
MSNELQMGNSSQNVTQNENLRAKDTEPQNITVILPAYNEEISIGSVVLRTKKYSHRVIVVDDASSDHTVDIAEMAGAQVIRNPTAKRNELSLKKGIEAASDSDIIVMMNLGVCHDPGLIPRMIAPIKDGDFELSVGVCFSKLQSSENVLLLNNKNTESRPIGFVAFSKNCLSKIDISQISLFSMRSLINSAQRCDV